MPSGRPGAIWLSATTGAGIGLLRDSLQEIFGQAAMRLASWLCRRPRAGCARGCSSTAWCAGKQPLADGGTRLVVESSHQQLESLCREAGVDFRDVVSPCLPDAGFVEFPRETARSAA